MIRQFFVNKVTPIFALILMFGCSSETVTNDIVVEETSKEKRRIPVTIDALVEYVKGTPERNKVAIRNKFERMGVLVSWEQCEIEDNDDVEVWLIDNVKLESYGKPDPLEHAEDDDDDVKRIKLNANCRDY